MLLLSNSADFLTQLLSYCVWLPQLLSNSQVGQENSWKNKIYSRYQWAASCGGNIKHEKPANALKLCNFFAPETAEGGGG